MTGIALTLVDVIITTDHHIVGMKQISLVKVFLPPFIAWFRLAAARRRPRSIGLRRCPPRRPRHSRVSVISKRAKEGAIHKGHPSMLDFGALFSAFGTYLSYDIQGATALAP